MTLFIRLISNVWRKMCPDEFAQLKNYVSEHFTSYDNLDELELDLRAEHDSYAYFSDPVFSGYESEREVRERHGGVSGQTAVAQVVVHGVHHEAAAHGGQGLS